MVLVPAYIATILTYLWVLWPVKPPLDKLTAGLKLQNAFYIHDPIALGSTWVSAMRAPGTPIRRAAAT